MKQTVLIFQLISALIFSFSFDASANPIDSIDFDIPNSITPDSTVPISKKASTLKEDCIDIDLETVKVAEIRGRFKIIDGERKNHFLLDFGKKRRIAYQALNVIEQYHANQACFIGRPGPSFTYILSDGDIPRGHLRGEECTRFDPDDIHIVVEKSLFKLYEKEELINFSIHEDEALKALITIKNYGFTNVCQVGKGSTTFTYLK